MTLDESGSESTLSSDEEEAPKDGENISKLLKKVMKKKVQVMQRKLNQKSNEVEVNKPTKLRTSFSQDGNSKGKRK